MTVSSPASFALKMLTQPEAYPRKQLFLFPHTPEAQPALKLAPCFDSRSLESIPMPTKARTDQSDGQDEPVRGVNYDGVLPGGISSRPTCSLSVAAQSMAFAPIRALVNQQSTSHDLAGFSALLPSPAIQNKVSICISLICKAFPVQDLARHCPCFP
jgi:hypothetical protein